MSPPAKNGHLSPAPAEAQDSKPNIRDHLSQEQLEAQLPDFTTETVQLGFLVDRLASDVYKDLHALAETLPSMTDLGRKQSLVQWIGQSGRRLIRLAVLARWSNHGPVLKKLANISGFLQNQNAQFEIAIKQLEAIHQSLLQARVRNYDLRSAVDMLSVGSYQRLPAVLQSWAEADKASTQETISTLHELNRCLRLRLAVSETLPSAMKMYSISDGKALFKVPGLFEASVTLAGSELSDRWFLLDITFLTNSSSSSSSSSSDESRTELDPTLKTQIVELGNRVLTDNPPEGLTKLKNQSKPALVRLYEFLENLALNFKLEQLHSQAVQLTRSYGWVGTLSVSQAKDRRSLDVSYWVDATNSQRFKPTASISSAKDAKTSPPPPKITLCIEEASTLPTSQAYLAALDGEESQTSHARLTFQWHPESSDLADAPEAKSPQTMEDDLHLEQLLSRLIRTHIDHLMRRLLRQTIDSGYFPASSLKAQFFEDTTPRQVTGFTVQLQNSSSVQVRIAEQSGRIQCAPLQAVFNNTVNNRIVRCGKAVNEARGSLPDALLKLRVTIVVDDLESKTSAIGLRHHKKQLHKTSDQVKFGSATRLPFFIHLHNQPTYFLAVVIAEHGLRFALVSFKIDAESPFPPHFINELGWIDTSKLGIQEDNGFQLSLRQLKRIYDYSCERFVSFNEERQLFARRIPYQHVPAKLPTAEPSELPTALLMRVADLMPTFGAYAHVAALAIFPTSTEKKSSITVKYALRLHASSLKKLPSSLTLPPSAHLDPLTNILTFKGSLQGFLNLLGHCERECRLADHPPPKDTHQDHPSS